LLEPNRISETSSRIGKPISLGKAAEIAEDSKRAFMDVLSRKGIPVINISPDECPRTTL
jgi:predicted HTH domain antitoxin